MAPPVPTIVLNDTRVDCHHGCTRVMEALEQLLAKNGCEIVARAPAHSDWANWPEVVRESDRARLVVVNGEGTIHHDRLAGLRLLQAGRWAKQRGIPAVLVNAGWEANSSATTTLLGDFALVAVRDGRSSERLQAAEVGCTQVPDLSMYVPAETGEAQRHGIAFTDSVDRLTTRCLDAARRAVDAPWLPIQASGKGLFDRLRFIRGGVAKMDLATPTWAFELLCARNSLGSRRQSTPEHFIRGASLLELLVSGRFHACTLALTAATPFVALPSNTSKIEALIEDVGLAGWRISGDISPGALEHARRIGWEPQEFVRLNEYLGWARRSMDDLFAQIRKLA